jgi:hypothetical protein
MFKIKTMNVLIIMFSTEEFKMTKIKQKFMFYLIRGLFIFLLAACSNPAGRSNDTDDDTGSSLTFSSVSNAFSAVIAQDGTVYWDKAIDSCDGLIEANSLKEEGVLKINILPDNTKDAPYLYPERAWKLLTEGGVMPSWFTEEYADAVWNAFNDWKNDVYSRFNYKLARGSYFDGTTISVHQPSTQDIDNFKAWIAVYDSLPTYVRGSVRDTINKNLGKTVGAALWNYAYGTYESLTRKARAQIPADEQSIGSNGNDFVGALAGQYLNVSEWNYYVGSTGGYPYQPAVALWKAGYTISLTHAGKWRLHNATDGTEAHLILSEDVAGNKAFACILTSTGTVYWNVGIDSTAELVRLNNVSGTPGTDYLNVNIIPENKDEQEYPYLYPDEDWVIVTDSSPGFLATYEDAIWTAFDSWKQVVYSFDYESALQDFSPTLAIEHNPTQTDLDNLKAWVIAWEAVTKTNQNVGSTIALTAWDKVGPCLWNDLYMNVEANYRKLDVDCSGIAVCNSVAAYLGLDKLDQAMNDTVGDSVSDGQRALYTTYFTNITEWKYKNGYTSGNPYTPGAALWQQGLIPSFDGTTWYLGSGSSCKVVYAILEKDLLAGNFSNDLGHY